jgi:hypothetical protein
MCGPIALALPLDRSSSYSIFNGTVIYNFGRISTYFLLGTFFGLVGNGIALAGFQQTLSISVGLIMILSVLLPFLKIKGIHFPSYSLWLGQLKGEMSKRFTSNKKGSSSKLNLFLIGILNGLLPCGLVYMAVAGAVAMASPLEGGFFMSIFGLGTLPLMLAIGIYGNQLQKNYLRPIKKLVPVFIFLIGSLFVLRGMNLGIPYVSPQLEASSNSVKCN